MKLKFIPVCMLGLGLVTALSSAAEVLRIAVIPKFTDNDYWRAVQAGAMKAQADLAAEGIAIKVIWDGPQSAERIEEQKEIVRRFVTQKVHGIVLAPVHAMALVKSAEQAVAAKIPVVAIDSPLNSDVAVSTVATNNYLAGVLAGHGLADAIDRKGKVFLAHYAKGHSSSLPREGGFLYAMKKYPGIEVVSTEEPTETAPDQAEQVAKAQLDRYASKVQGIFTPNLTATGGMLAALREAGLVGKIVLIGFDSNAAQIEALRKGELSGIIVQQPFKMGYLGVRAVVDTIRGKTVLKEIDTEVKLVTKENLESPEIQKLLNPSGN